MKTMGFPIPRDDRDGNGEILKKRNVEQLFACVGNEGFLGFSFSANGMTQPLLLLLNYWRGFEGWLFIWIIFKALLFLPLKDAYLNPSTEVLRLTRAGDIVKGILPNDPNDLWTVFYPNHTTYTAVALATPWQDGEEGSNGVPLVTVVQVRIEMYGRKLAVIVEVRGQIMNFWSLRNFVVSSGSKVSRWIPYINFLNHCTGQLAKSLYIRTVQIAQTFRPEWMTW